MKRKIRTFGGFLLTLAALTLFLHIGHVHNNAGSQDTHKCQICKISTATLAPGASQVSPIFNQQEAVFTPPGLFSLASNFLPCQSRAPPAS